MTRPTLTAILALSACLTSIGTCADESIPAQVLEHLEHMRATQYGMMNIAPAEGRYFYRLVKQLDAKRVLEIGTSNGYSAIWLALGLKETGGTLITLEIDERRYDLAAENFRNTNLTEVIDLRLVDALEEIPKISGPIDLVFIDAWKDDYPRYLELVLPKVRSGGIIAAHNVISHHSHGIKRYLELVEADPQLETSYIEEGPAGISISKKK